MAHDDTDEEEIVQRSRWIRQTAENIFDSDWPEELDTVDYSELGGRLAELWEGQQKQNNELPAWWDDDWREWLAEDVQDYIDQMRYQDGFKPWV